MLFEHTLSLPFDFIDTYEFLKMICTCDGKYK